MFRFTMMIKLHNRLSAAGLARLKSFVEQEKRSVKLAPLPPMGQQAAQNWLERLWARVSIPTVHAQMTPYASLYTAITSADSNGNVYATGTTNAQSGCNCHSTSAYTTLTLPNGHSAGDTRFGPGEVSQATAHLIVGSSDFSPAVDGTITANTTHTAYCPISQQQFVDSDTTNDTGTSRFIQAYYYCDPRGGPCATSLGIATYDRCRAKADACDTVTGFKIPGGFSNFPPYAIANCVLIDIGITQSCVGGTLTAADNCGIADPRP